MKKLTTTVKEGRVIVDGDKPYRQRIFVNGKEKSS